MLLLLRYAVGWLLGRAEPATLASELIGESRRKQGIFPGHFAVHAEKTDSRLQVPNENPFSESQRKMLKYRPEFPGRFGRFRAGGYL